MNPLLPVILALSIALLIAVSEARTFHRDTLSLRQQLMTMTEAAARANASLAAFKAALQAHEDAAAKTHADDEAALQTATADRDAARGQVVALTKQIDAGAHITADELNGLVDQIDQVTTSLGGTAPAAIVPPAAAEPPAAQIPPAAAEPTTAAP